MSKTKKYPAGFGVIDRRYHALHEDLKPNPAFDGKKYQPGIALAVFMHLMLNAKPSEQRCKLFKVNSNSVVCKKLQGLTSLRTLIKTLGFTKHKIEHALNRLEEKGWITVEKCKNIKGAGLRNGARYTINKGYSFDHPFNTSDTCSDDTNNSSNKNKEIVGGKIPLTRESALAYAKEKINDSKSANWAAGVDADYIVEEFLNWIDAGNKTGNWKNTLLRFIKNANKYNDAAKSNLKTNNFSKPTIKTFNGKGIDALREIDRKANKAA